MKTIINTVKRPQLLTVICILSFVMCAINIGTSVVNVFLNTPESQRQNIEQLKIVSPQMADSMESTMMAMESNVYLKYSQHLNIVYNLLAFLGVLMMWNFNKTGFYIYSIAEILPYISYVFIDMSSISVPGLPAGSAATYMMIALVFMILIDLVFVVLYAKSFKEIEQQQYNNQRIEI